MVPNCVRVDGNFLHASEFEEEADAAEAVLQLNHFWVSSHNFFDRMGIATTSKIGLRVGQKLKRIPQIFEGWRTELLGPPQE